MRLCRLEIISCAAYAHSFVDCSKYPLLWKDRTVHARVLLRHCIDQVRSAHQHSHWQHVRTKLTPLLQCASACIRHFFTLRSFVRKCTSTFAVHFLALRLLAAQCRFSCGSSHSCSPASASSHRPSTKHAVLMHSAVSLRLMLCGLGFCRLSVSAMICTAL